MARPKPPNTPETLKEVFKTKTTKDGTCLVWNGPWAGAGYGYVMINDQRVSARRVAYELHHDVTLKSSQTVVRRQKLCDHIRCVNPRHLELRERGKGGRTSS